MDKWLNEGNMIVVRRSLRCAMRVLRKINDIMVDQNIAKEEKNEKKHIAMYRYTYIELNNSHLFIHMLKIPYLRRTSPYSLIKLMYTNHPYPWSALLYLIQSIPAI